MTLTLCASAQHNFRPTDRDGKQVSVFICYFSDIKIRLFKLSVFLNWLQFLAQFLYC